MYKLAVGLERSVMPRIMKLKFESLLPALPFSASLNFVPADPPNPTVLQSDTPVPKPQFIVSGPGPLSPTISNHRTWMSK